MQPLRVPHAAVVRWALGVAVTLAVIGMHALMGPGAAVASASRVDPPAHHEVGGAPTHTQLQAGTAAPVGVPAISNGTDNGGGGHHTGHALAHLCLAVLAGVITALLLALTLAPLRSASTRAAWRAASATGAGRAPPWTQLSLAQLSVLRV